MKKVKSMALKLWRDESGQGTAEYVLILVAVVTVGYLFRDQIKGILSKKLGTIGTEVQSFAIEKK